MVLPVDIDTTYADDAGDSTVALHQQHHDEIHAKLNGVEALADVTDATNVAAAGALMANTTAALATDEVLDVRVTGDTYPRLYVDGDGNIVQGTGLADPTVALATVMDGTAYTDIFNGHQLVMGLDGDGDMALMAYDSGSNEWSGIRVVNNEMLVGQQGDTPMATDFPDSTKTFTGLDISKENFWVQIYIDDDDLYGFKTAGIYFDADASGTANDLRISPRGDSLVPINTQTVSYTLVLADSGKAVEMNSGSATVLTIPTNTAVAFPVGTIIEVCRLGTGAVSVTPDVGVTLRAPGSLLSLRSQYSSASLRKRATNEWVLAGDMA